MKLKTNGGTRKHLDEKGEGKRQIYPYATGKVGTVLEKTESRLFKTHQMGVSEHDEEKPRKT